MKKIIIITVIAITIVSMTACATEVESLHDKPIVAVSIVPQETFVKAVAGDLVDVITMIPPGNSPANYQPTPQQMQKLSEASVYFAIGVPTELANILPKVKDINEDIEIISLEKSVAEVYDDRYFDDEKEHDCNHVNDDEKAHKHGEDNEQEECNDEHGCSKHGEDNQEEECNDEHGCSKHGEDNEEECNDEHDSNKHGEDNQEEECNDEHDCHNHVGRDPHIWLSPKRVKVMIEDIKDKLIELNPENKEVYEKNSSDYIEKLNEVDNEIELILKGLEKKSFIIYHPAFGYFADDYGIEMVAIEESGKEATVKRLQHVIDLANAEGIKVIFYQAEFDSQQAETIAQEIGGEVVKVEPLSSDYLENLKKIANTFKEVLK